MRSFGLVIILLLSVIPHSVAQRTHSATASSGASLVPATERAQHSQRVTIAVEGDFRMVTANGVPSHAVGPFPNGGNPHSITLQSYTLRMPLRPRVNRQVTALRMAGNFGVAINGVPFDPRAAEWYQGDRSSVWQYEALSGAVPLGVDANHAHSGAE